ncbi:uncharacterized protein LOC117324953 [Pecten maximus]|uniref:uncharacterized protein LOC117324953 n=1 Tax=Pecten maximus TaxID=6579 RepID=UPI001458A646|nr:uncharacterized protein LOC117324953 [Pecten maximus]XP_033736686.1 uncharacterized protein LOC117324953 [Pecten maximus]XP_033736687.1 uncharacterized protein LOC117324953 [Pecten maximus]
MEPKNRPRLDGVFPEMNTDKDGDAPLSPVRKQIEQFEKRGGKGPAPLPQGGFHLPKIGNYKPKSLLTSEPCSPEQKDNTRLSDGFTFEPINFVIREKDDPPPQPKSFILMGDNQQLMTIHNGEREGDHEEDSGIASPDKPAFTENPLFDKDSPESPLLENYKDDESGIYQQLDNPGFVDNAPSDVNQHFNDVNEFDDIPPADYPLEEEEEDRPKPPPRKKKGKTLENGEGAPYIPVPDYDEGSTRKFNGGPTDAPRHEPIFEEFGGEDYSKYLSDEEDYEFDTSLTWRKEMKHKRYKAKNNKQGTAQRSKGRTAVQMRRPPDGPKPQQEIRPIGTKSRKQLETVHESMRRNTIRDFTFADSKIGNGTVRSTVSTSAKGRYMKRNKERGRIVENEEGTYEDFLRNRHNENGSNSSNDSGIVPGEEINYHNHVFMHSQPKLKDGKSSLWKKLTWKFKRNTSGYQMS